MSQRFAVLVGVEHYAHPSPDLRAPTNDVVDWSRLLTKLGFAGMRVATCPVLAPADLPDGVRCSGATTAEVDESLRWLVNAVRDAGKDALGVVFFCGHGALRPGEGDVLYLSDYAEVPPRAPGGPLAKDGSIHLEDLRLRFATHAPQGRLLAIVDTCRTGPLEAAVTDVDHPWRQPGYPHTLLTAADLGQRAYERVFEGRSRGLFTWAVTTVLDQWATGGVMGESGYVALTPAELVRRAGQLIDAVSPAAQPQLPRVYAPPELAGTPFLANRAGAVLADAQAGVGHEWSASTNGIIVKSGATIGWFSVASGSNPTLTLKFKAASAPTTALGLTFTVTPTVNPVGVNSTYTAAFASWTPEGTPGTMPYDAAAKVALAISGLTWTWHKLDATGGCSNLSGSQTFANGTPPAAPVGKTWYALTDTLVKS